MRVPLCLLSSAMLASFAAFASQNDCTYDQSHQIEVLQEIASRRPGAVLAEDERTVRWTDEDGSETVVRYGGCDHLGFMVSSTRARTEASPEAEVLRVARSLAREFWHESDAKDLEQVVAARELEKEAMPSGVVYRLEHESYDEFVVEHELVDGRERIAIRWARSF